MTVTSDSIVAKARRDRRSRLGILEEPMGYVDGQNLYEFVQGDPVGLLDPSGTVSIDLTFDTGSENKERPWVGAVWTNYRTIKDDQGNPGLVRIASPTVTCTCTKDCKVQCSVSVRIRMELRNTADKSVIRNTDGRRTLTDVGRRVYGHEQLHIKDYVTQIKAMVDAITAKAVDGANAGDCKKNAADAERQLRKAIEDLRTASQPGGKGPDHTHGGLGQPVSGQGYDPEGEPGPWVNS